MFLQLGVQIFPEWLIGFLWSPISRHPNYSDCIIRNGFLPIDRDILFDDDLQSSFLAALNTVRVFTDMLTWNDMFNDLEGERHIGAHGLIGGQMDCQVDRYVVVLAFLSGGSRPRRSNSDSITLQLRWKTKKGQVKLRPTSWLVRGGGSAGMGLGPPF